MQDLLARNEHFRRGLPFCPVSAMLLERLHIGLIVDRIPTERLRAASGLGVVWGTGRMEKNAHAQILMKDDTQLLNFKGYPMAFSRHSTNEPAERKSLSTSTNLI